MSAFDLFIQQFINGMIKGSLYAMIALGYTMVYGILGIINFSHGEVFMIGAMVAMTVTTLLIKAGLGEDACVIDRDLGRDGGMYDHQLLG